jgi:hypothetical protein
MKQTKRPPRRHGTPPAKRPFDIDVAIRRIREAAAGGQTGRTGGVAGAGIRLFFIVATK